MIKNGDTVTILGVSKKDHHFNDRKRYIGRSGIISDITKALSQKSWFACYLCLDGVRTYFYRVQLMKRNVEDAED